MAFWHRFLILSIFLAAGAIPAQAQDCEIDEETGDCIDSGGCDICDWKNWFTSKKKQKRENAPLYYKEGWTDYVNDRAYIGLKNQWNRAVVYCYDNAENSAESCAQYFESQGYTRFQDIPYKTANYDFLKVDTYPTRRWRDNELTPRW